MFTPQQIDQITFSKSTFGGYNMEQVDEVLEPLTEDYVNLYKENALLKSKMRVLVGKLEEYRKNEAAIKDAVANTQKSCSRMIKETEAKCQVMMQNARANASAAPAAPVTPVASETTEALIAAENARVEAARKAANAKIAEIQAQMQSCIQALERIKSANPTAVPAAPAVPAATMQYDGDAVASQIAQNLEAMVGTTEDVAPKAAPRHPVADTTSRFSNLDLQFGRNYDVSHK